MNDPAAIQTYWNPWYVHMYRHSGFRANMLYLDGHVGTVKTILYSGQINYVWSYSSSP